MILHEHWRQTTHTTFFWYPLYAKANHSPPDRYISTAKHHCKVVQHIACVMCAVAAAWKQHQTTRNVFNRIVHPSRSATPHLRISTASNSIAVRWSCSKCDQLLHKLIDNQFLNYIFSLFISFFPQNSNRALNEIKNKFISISSDAAEQLPQQLSTNTMNANGRSLNHHFYHIRLIMIIESLALWSVVLFDIF